MFPPGLRRLLAHAPTAVRGERLLLDVQQVIPSPEASELTIQLQRKATQERAVRITDGRDWTRYVITGPSGESEPLRKRQAILTMVATLRAAGVPAPHQACARAVRHRVRSRLVMTSLRRTCIEAHVREGREPICR